MWMVRAARVAGVLCVLTLCLPVGLAEGDGGFVGKGDVTERREERFEEMGNEPPVEERAAPFEVPGGGERVGMENDQRIWAERVEMGVGILIVYVGVRWLRRRLRK